MKKYVFSKKNNGVHVFDIQKLYEKIKVAAKIIASIPDPSSIIVKILFNLNPISLINQKQAENNFS
jgi:ribosomal protein S2